VTNVGPDLQIDVDELVDLDPHLVLAAESVPGMEEVNERLADTGLPHRILAPSSLAEIRGDVREVGEALGVPERGERIARGMLAHVEAVEAALEGVETVDVYWEWWPRPAYTPGNRGWTHEVIERAGGRNVFGDRDEQSLAVDLSEVREADPYVVALCWQGTLHSEQSRERFLEREEGAWGRLEAAQAGRILLMEEALFGRPGPRIVEGLRKLAAQLHPDRRDELPEAYAWVPDGLKDRLSL
jgi:iron complex transport system substrate-binding protein